MSNLLGILESISADDKGRILVMCQPITESAPRDIPEVKEIADQYWTAKIIIKNGDRHNNITEWFSIPYVNLRSSLDNHINGPCIISYEDIDVKSKNELLKDSRPVFSLNTENHSSTYRWFNDRST